MRIYSAEKMRAADMHAIKKVGISSLVLMENAGVKILFTLEKIFSGLKGKRFTIVCGKGNNGGDGLVIARHLLNSNLPVNLFLTSQPEKLSQDALVNYNILKECGLTPSVIQTPDDVNRLRVAMEFSDCVFDCVFGTGFTGEIKGNIARIVSAMNDTRAIKIAVDMPSGVCATTGKASQVCIRADYTITLGAPKIGLFLLPGKKFAGEVWLADIGIPEVSFADAQPDCFLVSSQMVRSLLPARPAEMHKGVGGNLLLLAGSVQYSGAPVVASYGALRSGAGIVTLGLPDALNGKMYFQLLPETILRFFPSQEGCFSLQKEIINEFNSTYRAILAGSGWGRSAELKKTLEVLLSNWKGRLVLDADALNLLEDPQKLGELEFIPVVTPHLGEMARLTRKSIAEIQDNSISCARDFARKYQTVVVLKSAVTLIASPDGRMFVSSRPNTGLARGGSGDLLAGFITGLLATGMPPLDAAISGVHIMADAGELAVEELGEDSVTVSEVASYIPRAFLRLRRGKVEQEQP